MTPDVKAFFDEPTNTVCYLVWDPATKRGAVDRAVGCDDRGTRARRDPGADLGFRKHAARGVV